MIRTIPSLAAAALAFSAAVQAAPISNGNSTYDIITVGAISWTDANAAVSALGSGWHLAAITTAEEQAFITNTVGGPNHPGEFWLGAYQTGNVWTWVTGEAWDYTNWNPGEPNDNYGPASENYLATWGSGTWKWNDEGNLGNITGYVAEYNHPAVPEPTTLALMGLGLFGLGFLARRRKKT